MHLCVTVRVDALSLCDDCVCASYVCVCVCAYVGVHPSICTATAGPQNPPAVHPIRPPMHVPLRACDTARALVCESDGAHHSTGAGAGPLRLPMHDSDPGRPPSADHHLGSVDQAGGDNAGPNASAAAAPAPELRTPEVARRNLSDRELRAIAAERRFLLAAAAAHH